MDPGCQIFSSSTGICQKCSDRFYFNMMGKCTQVSARCQTFNSFGQCRTCYSDYKLVSGDCQQQQPDNSSVATNPGCASWNWETKACLKCANGWYQNSQSLCVAGPSNCASFDSNGVCTLCYRGYDLIGSQCVDNGGAPVLDQNCNTWDYSKNVCSKCIDGTLFDSSTKMCSIVISTFCKTSDSNGLCSSCYIGYTLVNGGCVLATISQNAFGPVGCSSWDSFAQKCSACASYFVFFGPKCIPVNPLCKTYDSNGFCRSCFQGYNLDTGNCLKESAAPVVDVNCFKFSADQKTCLQCSSGSFFNTQGVCTQVSENCQASGSDGKCTSCFVGFFLSNGVCNKYPAGYGVGCQTWSVTGCTKCAYRYFYDSASSSCMQVSDLCATYDSTSGQCLTCYIGYNLNNGACVLASQTPVPNGCKQFDSKLNVCMTCSDRYVFDSNGVCQKISDLC